MFSIFRIFVRLSKFQLNLVCRLKECLHGVVSVCTQIFYDEPSTAPGSLRVLIFGSILVLKAS